MDRNINKGRSGPKIRSSVGSKMRNIAVGVKMTVSSILALFSGGDVNAQDVLPDTIPADQKVLVDFSYQKSLLGGKHRETEADLVNFLEDEYFPEIEKAIWRSYGTANPDQKIFEILSITGIDDSQLPDSDKLDDHNDALKDPNDGYADEMHSIYECTDGQIKEHFGVYRPVDKGQRNLDYILQNGDLSSLNTITDTGIHERGHMWGAYHYGEFSDSSRRPAIAENIDTEGRIDSSYLGKRSIVATNANRKRFYSNSKYANGGYGANVMGHGVEKIKQLNEQNPILEAPITGAIDTMLVKNTQTLTVDENKDGDYNTYWTESFTPEGEQGEEGGNPNNATIVTQHQGKFFDFTPAEAGTYVISTFTQKDCGGQYAMDEITIYVDQGVSTENPESNSEPTILIGPNPTDGAVNLIGEVSKVDMNILTDVRGNRIFVTDKTRFDLNDLNIPSGIYYIQSLLKDGTVAPTKIVYNRR